jgi:uncharacterized protein (DUF1697 family)
MPAAQPPYVALLRGVNVGGNRKVVMAELREFAARAGLNDPRTLLQSGNLVFRAPSRPASEFERLLEVEAEKQLGLRTDFLVRTADEWKRVVARNPFTQEALRDPSHLLVMFLKDSTRKTAVDAVRAANPGPETIHAAGRELYIVFPRGIGTSKLPNLLTEARLGTRGTGRNWNTVLKLLALTRS